MQQSVRQLDINYFSVGISGTIGSIKTGERYWDRGRRTYFGNRDQVFGLTQPKPIQLNRTSVQTSQDFLNQLNSKISQTPRANQSFSQHFSANKSPLLTNLEQIRGESNNNNNLQKVRSVTEMKNSEIKFQNQQEQKDDRTEKSQNGKLNSSQSQRKLFFRPVNNKVYFEEDPNFRNNQETYYGLQKYNSITQHEDTQQLEKTNKLDMLNFNYDELYKQTNNNNTPSQKEGKQQLNLVASARSLSNKSYKTTYQSFYKDPWVSDEQRLKKSQEEFQKKQEQVQDLQSQQNFFLELKKKRLQKLQQKNYHNVLNSLKNYSKKQQLGEKLKTIQRQQGSFKKAHLISGKKWNNIQKSEYYI